MIYLILAVINSKGDLYQWANYTNGIDYLLATPELTIRNKKLYQLDINSKLVACLSRKGEVYLVNEKTNSNITKNFVSNQPQSWLKYLISKFNHIEGKCAELNSYSVAKFADHRNNKEIIIKICIGEHHLLALTKDGNVYSGKLTEGGNVMCQQGRGITEETIKLEKLLVNQKSFYSKFYLKDYFDYKAAKQTVNKVLNADVSRNKPVWLHKVSSTNKKFKDIACGENHSVILDTTGTAYTFGSNEFLVLYFGVVLFIIILLFSNAVWVHLRPKPT